jgi:predicted Zn-dependent protease with MMP-like domain
MRRRPSDFERLVAEALDALPAPIAAMLENVEVVIQEWPTPQQLAATGLRRPSDLMGLYEGTPLTERSSWYGNTVPDHVIIFSGPILAAVSSPADVREEVRRTVIHELAHHFGIDDDRLEELGAY